MDPFTVLLSAFHLSLDIATYDVMCATPGSEVQAFQKAVVLLPEVVEVHHIAGAFDYLLRIAVADLASYETFHADRLTALPGVANITSYVVMSRLK